MAETVPSKHRLPSWLKYPLLVITLLAVLTLSFFSYAGLLGNNFRVVDAEKAYRSGQMTASELNETLKKYQIKCVLNLRGETHGQWYKDEVDVCDQAKVPHYDIHLRLGELPSPDAVKSLVEHIEAGPFPLLYHCKNGADRTGMATVFYEMIVKKAPLDDALNQMSWRQGHLNMGKAEAMDRFFALYRQTGLGHDLKDWVINIYPGVYGKENARLAGTRSNGVRSEE